MQSYYYEEILLLVSHDIHIVIKRSAGYGMKV